MNIKNIFVIFSVIVCSTAYSQSEFTLIKNPNEFKLKLKEATKSTNSVESDFTQNKNLSMLAKPINSKGKFWYKKEKKVRWEYTTPYLYLVIINDTKLFIKDKNNKEQYDTQSNKMFQQLNDFLIGCINGEILNNTKDFELNFKENETLYFVTLIPKAQQMKKMISEIHIYFDKKDLSVSKLKMVEQGGDYTVIEFFNKKLNVSISDEKFNFN